MKQRREGYPASAELLVLSEREVVKRVDANEVISSHAA